MTRYFITTDDAVERIFEVLRIMRGNEIFCPKMPSVKMADLARAITNNGPVKITGKRSGEKTHEDIIVSEQASKTYETQNFFITTDIYRGLGHKVPPDFYYRSDKNWVWLDPGVIINK